MVRSLSNKEAGKIFAPLAIQKHKPEVKSKKIHCKNREISQLSEKNQDIKKLVMIHESSLENSYQANETFVKKGGKSELAKLLFSQKIACTGIFIFFLPIIAIRKNQNLKTRKCPIYCFLLKKKTKCKTWRKASENCQQEKYNN